MKLELPGIMICEWDAVTQCIIVSPADGWKVNVKSTLYPISEAHASLVTMEKMEEDCSHLIGKWVRFISFGDSSFTKNKWYKCVSHPKGGVGFISNQEEVDTWVTNGRVDHNVAFDLSDPRDENPCEQKETRIPFDLERWKAGEGILRAETQGGDEVTHLTHFEGMCLIGKVNHSLGFWGESGKCNHFRPNNDLTLIVKQ